MAKRYRKTSARRKVRHARAHNRRRVSSHRRRNPMHHRVHHRRRSHNPFGSSGKGLVMTGAGILGGVALTKVIRGVIPSSLTASLPANLAPFITTAGAALVTGFVADRFVKGDLGKAIFAGAVAAAGYVLIDSFAPSLSSYAQFGVSGMGDIIPGMFTVPQNPVKAGQMLSLPAAPVSAKSSGIGVAAFPRAF